MLFIQNSAIYWKKTVTALEVISVCKPWHNDFLSGSYIFTVKQTSREPIVRAGWERLHFNLWCSVYATGFFSSFSYIDSSAHLAIWESAEGEEADGGTREFPIGGIVYCRVFPLLTDAPLRHYSAQSLPLCLKTF